MLCVALTDPLARAQEGEWIPGQGKSELFFTYGDEERVRGPKAVYFVRTSDKVDVEKVRHVLY